MSAVHDGIDEEHAASQHCYRHLYREARVTCTRCEQPICPQCMVSAAVGFQCPECVRGGRRNTPAPRTVLGARTTPAAGQVTMLLIAANLVVFGLVRWLGDGFLADVLLVGKIGPYGVADGQWWRLISAAFTQQAFLHIASNMFALYLIGPALEQLLGRVRFVALYFTCALGGATATYVFATPYTESLGASGAIMGLFGAAAIILHRLNYSPAPVLLSIAMTLALPLVVSGIDWHAHVGGLITGALLGSAFAYAPPKRRTVVGVGAVAAVLVVLVVMIVMRTNTLNAA